ncbi:hypothetical protein DSO57_1015425 [Entomophthora muscae]|uniref:Uncharacterized protein n=1 Tax=Entomophthora muscae TaxID=34485 RepID=A0ACC2T5L4_9FUNG|nr:hypothetical protein DSO57_1015425 [Entomophthora muscae]
MAGMVVTQPHRRWGPGGGLGMHNGRNGNQRTQNQTQKATYFPIISNVTGRKS